MKYTEHDFYKRNKHAREQIERFFGVSDNDNETFLNLFYEMINDILSECSEQKRKDFSHLSRCAFYRRGIQENAIKPEGIYLMTEGQIKKNLKKYDYEVSESHIKTYSGRWWMPNYHVFAVRVGSLKDDK